MIPHSSAGQPWGHPMRALNGGPGRVDLAQMAGQYDPPSVSSQQSISQLQSQPPLPPQPPIRQTPVVDLTASGFESQDGEPPPKRPRLDISGGSNLGDAGSTMNSAEPRSTPASASSRPQLSWRGRPLWSFQAVMSEVPSSENRGDGTATSRPPSPPPFPARPWTNALPERQRNADSSSRDPSPVRKVSTVPYRVETPSEAPILKGESKLTNSLDAMLLWATANC
jgi:mediator of RNA polymerase II transcription subunit 12